MLFGEYLIKNGILTQQQVKEALRVQSELSAESGYRKLFGDIAVDLGYIKKDTIEKAFIAYFNHQ